MERVDSKGRVIMGVVSMETGEIVDEVCEGDKVKITRKASIDYLEQYQEWPLKRFYKGHAEEMKLLLEELSLSEKAFLFSVAPYIGYDDCCVKHSNGREITTKDLVKITGLSKGTVNSVINSLVQKDVLFKGVNSKNRIYFINPWLFCVGQRINKVLKTMFKNYKVRVHGGVAWKDLKE